MGSPAGAGALGLSVRVAEGGAGREHQSDFAFILGC